MRIGLIGLGTMGANLARNAARNGATVAVFNRTTEKTDAFMKNFQKEGSFVETKSIEEFMKALPSPRVIVLMVKAGDAVDATIAELTSFLSKGDIVIDAGNSHYTDTNKRVAVMKEHGVHFIGLGVSGGEEGALHGPSMMPGGDKKAYATIEPLLMKMAADDGVGGKCIAYLGEGGAGHFVKMVHNGIEYGIMQLIAETYDVLKREGGVSNKELAHLFNEWNRDPHLSSFLIEITAKIFAHDGDLIDVILDKAGQKGTGKWTTESAMNYGVAIPTITAAVDARIISGAKDFRIQRSKDAPVALIDDSIDRKELIALAKDALTLSIMSAYSEGFLLMTTASQAEQWNLPIAEIARIWRGGCIIRSKLLDSYQNMFNGDKDAQMLLRNIFSDDRQKNWRKFVMHAISKGIPTPSMTAALHSYDAYRTERLPQNLIQAQRDFFGAHTFERTDTPGTFHEQW